jgi:hypothetical protein
VIGADAERCSINSYKSGQLIMVTTMFRSTLLLLFVQALFFSHLASAEDLSRPMVRLGATLPLSGDIAS